MLDLSQIRRAFNRSAATVKQADVLQHEVLDRLVERMVPIRLQPHRILQCGVGSTDMTELLCSQFPNAEMVVLDCADQRLTTISKELCLKTTAHYAALPFENKTFDMVVSSLDLHWTNDLAACFREFRRLLKPNGLVIFTLFGVETLKELRQSFSQCHSFLHRFPDMHDVGDLLLQSGFENPVMDMEHITIRYKKLETLFQDLKLSGTGNAHQKRPKGLFGKNRWTSAIAQYKALREDGIHPATFEIIYGHAWQPEQEEDDAIQEVRILMDRIQY